MKENKLFAQRIGLLGFTSVLSIIIKLLLVPILTKNMPVSEYGIWVQVNATIGLIPPIVGLGLPFAIVRFLASTRNKKELQEGFYSISIIVLIISGVVSLIFFLFATPLSRILFNNNLSVTRILPVILFTQSLIDLPMNLFRVLQKIKIHCSFLLLDMILTVSFASYFVFLGDGIYGAIFGLLISKILILVSMTALVLYKIGFSTPRFINTKKYISFSIPLLPSNFSSWIINSSDRYLITIFLGTAFVGYYAPGYTLGSFIQMFASPFSFILPPVLSKYFDEKNIDQVKKILKYSIKYYLLITIPAIFGLSILSKSILRILTTPEISTFGYLITPFTAVSYLIYGVQGIIGNILIINNKTKIAGLAVSLSAIVNLSLNVFLIPIIGINGAALTTLIGFLINFIITVYYSAKYIKFDSNLKFIMKSLVSSSIMSLLIFYLNPFNLNDLLFTIAVSAGLYFVIIFLFKGINKEEIRFFLNLLKN